MLGKHIISYFICYMYPPYGFIIKDMEEVFAELFIFHIISIVMKSSSWIPRHGAL